jgi:hypothetical protein
VIPWALISDPSSPTRDVVLNDSGLKNGNRTLVVVTASIGEWRKISSPNEAMLFRKMGDEIMKLASGSFASISIPPPRPENLLDVVGSVGAEHEMKEHPLILHSTRRGIDAFSPPPPDSLCLTELPFTLHPLTFTDDPCPAPPSIEIHPPFPANRVMLVKFDDKRERERAFWDAITHPASNVMDVKFELTSVRVADSHASIRHSEVEVVELTERPSRTALE